MKKILLFTILLVGLGLSRAQLISISFEESENYVLGNIDGQNRWRKSLPDATHASSAINQVVSDERARGGKNSLKITREPDYPELYTETAIGAIYSLPETISTNKYEISFDIFLAANPGPPNTSDFDFKAANPDEKVLSSLRFDYKGWILLSDYDYGYENFVYTTKNWSPNTWYHVRAIFDVAGNRIDYYLNGASLGSRRFVTPTDKKLSFVKFLHNNYYGGSAYIDNIVISSELLGTEDPALPYTTSRTLIYPNPVKDVFRVSLSDKFKNPDVTAIITDLSGRIVKQFTADVKSYNISDLAPGVYLVTFDNGSVKETEKLIKE
ncbi:MAG: T9SS type A sorting domain-containing protein [Flavobacteriaceae bacterium]|jgi:hypothetical protein|nr:T9SS type A sorting domain-containing protein [Flavobacteriaceae bacterium]